MAPLWERLAAATVVDLAHPLERGMPVSPNHPPYQMALLRRHGDVVRADGTSAANEIIVTGGHVGTHVDALGHVSRRGFLHGDIEAKAVQGHLGLTQMGIEEVQPFLTRGVLLDVAGALGVDVVHPGYEVSVEDLEAAARMAGVEVRPGDAVLIRTGWSRHWGDPDVFRGQIDGAPGPGEAAARWLADHDIRLTGAETIAYEVIHPGHGHSLLPAHDVLLFESGIHIVEVMNLDGLAAAGVHEFSFVAVPLRLVGATGSPIRPLALLDG